MILATTVDSNTLIPLGIVSGVGAALLIGLWRTGKAVVGSIFILVTRLNTIDNSLKTLAEAVANQWTEKDHKIWALELKILNPGLVIPDSAPGRKAKDIVEG